MYCVTFLCGLQNVYYFTPCCVFLGQNSPKYCCDDHRIITLSTHEISVETSSVALFNVVDYHLRAGSAKQCWGLSWMFVRSRGLLLQVSW